VLHLERFVEYLTGAYGHDRLSPVNHHLASVSGFLAWVVAQGCGGLQEGNPAAGVRTLVLLPLEPRALTPAQVRCRAEVT
jgi:hypothetical protein